MVALNACRPIIFPLRRPLPNRRTIILTNRVDATRKEFNLPPEVIVAPSFEDALKTVSPDSPTGKDIESVYVIGGGILYAECLDSKYCKRVLRTSILSEAFQDCDTFFPELLEDQWKRVSCSEVMEENGLKFIFEDFKRIENPGNGYQKNADCASRNHPTPAAWYDKGVS